MQVVLLQESFNKLLYKVNSLKNERLCVKRQFGYGLLIKKMWKAMSKCQKLIVNVFFLAGH